MFIEKESNLGIYLKLICVALLWGGTFIAGRVITSEIPPQIAALFRFIIASILLIFLVIKSETGFVKINFKEHLYIAGMGLTGIFAYNIFFFSALSYMEAGRTALFVSLSPVLTIVMAGIVFKEYLSGLNYCGVIITFVGTLIVVSKGHLLYQLNYTFGWGEIMMSCAVVSWVIYTLLCKKLKYYTPLIITTYSTLWGTLFLFISCIPNLNQLTAFNFNLSIYLSIFYLGVLGTVLAFFWYTQGITQIGASKTIIFNNFVPLFAIILSFFLLNESITKSMILGGLLNIIGVMLTNWKKDVCLHHDSNRKVQSNI